MRRTRYNEGLVALKKVAQANRTFITQYPDKSLSGLISNTDTNIFTGTCKDNIDSTKTAVLVQCGYLIKDNWDSLAFNIYVCNPLSDAGGGCCAKGRYASMKYKNLAATSTATDYCGYINSNMELQEVGTPW
ncbi:MAG: hypothetical protein LBI01_06600 [Elusimicrobium sp.]|nr:hypothetical protein [Elusimicrobium sp.]